MIKHIVLWKLKENAEGKSKKENALQIKKILEDLKNVIPQITELEVGINFNDSTAAYDVALYSIFQTVKDLDTYQNHPDHVKAADVIGKLREERVVVDYEV